MLLKRNFKILNLEKIKCKEIGSYRINFIIICDLNIKPLLYLIYYKKKVILVNGFCSNALFL